LSYALKLLSSVLDEVSLLRGCLLYMSSLELLVADRLVFDEVRNTISCSDLS